MKNLGVCKWETTVLCCEGARLGMIE
jgi:hypothetical protein